MSEKDSQAIFLETLRKLVEKAKNNKDTINIDEISIAFEGMNLPVEEIEGIYDYLKNQAVPQQSVGNAVTRERRAHRITCPWGTRFCVLFLWYNVKVLFISRF